MKATKTYTSSPIEDIQKMIDAASPEIAEVVVRFGGRVLGS